MCNETRDISSTVISRFKKIPGKFQVQRPPSFKVKLLQIFLYFSIINRGKILLFFRFIKADIYDEKPYNSDLLLFLKT